MSDLLERYVNNNRDAFDDETPNPLVWDHIDRELSRPGNKRLIFWRAAAIIFLVTTAVLSLEKITRSNQELVVPVDREFQEAEAYYVKAIEEKKLLLRTLGPNQLQSEFDEDLAKLDEIYHRLKVTLLTHSGDSKVTAAIISNLRIRLEVLNRQIEIVEDLAYMKDKKNVEEI